LLGVGDGGGQGLLAQHVHAAAGGLQHEVLVVGVGAGHDDRVGSLGPGVPGLLVGGDHAHAAHVVVAVGIGDHQVDVGPGLEQCGVGAGVGVRAAHQRDLERGVVGGGVC